MTAFENFKKEMVKAGKCVLFVLCCLIAGILGVLSFTLHLVHSFVQPGEKFWAITDKIHYARFYILSIPE